jgi:hypothetical protein
MNLVVNQVMQFEHVHGAHGNLLPELFPGAAVEKGRLTGGFSRLPPAGFDLVSPWRRRKPGWPCERRSYSCGHFQTSASSSVDRLFGRGLGKIRFQLFAQAPWFFPFRSMQLIWSPSPLAASPGESPGSGPRSYGMAHPGVEHHVHRSAVFEIGHIFQRQDPGHDALVAVASGHFVAHRKFALHGHVDLDHFDHAGRQVVALFEAADLLLEIGPDMIALTTIAVPGCRGPLRSARHRRGPPSIWAIGIPREVSSA